jgi:hypothetical protein
MRVLTGTRWFSAIHYLIPRARWLIKMRVRSGRGDWQSAESIRQMGGALLSSLILNLFLGLIQSPPEEFLEPKMNAVERWS